MEVEKHKVCFRCGETKPLSHFYKHPKMLDGHLNKCKTCTKSDVRDNREKNVDYYRAYDTKRNYSRNRVEARQTYSAEYASKNPIVKSAQTKVNNAVRDKRIFRPTCCEFCGNHGTIHAHHSSYSEDMWLVVTWLCAACHHRLHKDFEFQLNCWAT